MRAYITSIVIAVFILGTEAEWHQVWEDEFNGNELNQSNWFVYDTCDGNY